MDEFLGVMLYLFPAGIREVVKVLCYCFVTFTLTGVIIAVCHAFKQLKGLFRLG